MLAGSRRRGNVLQITKVPKMYVTSPSLVPGSDGLEELEGRERLSTNFLIALSLPTTSPTPTPIPHEYWACSFPFLFFRSISSFFENAVDVSSRYFTS